MNEQRRFESVALVQVFLCITAVINDCGVGAISRGCQEGHQSAQTKAHDGDLPIANLQLCRDVDGVLDVLRAGITVIGLIETQAMLPVRFGTNAEVDARLLPPEQIRSYSDEALFSQFVAGCTDVRVDPKYLVEDDDGRRRHNLRSDDIGAKLAIPSPYCDVIMHCVLPAE